MKGLRPNLTERTGILSIASVIVLAGLCSVATAGEKPPKVTLIVKMAKGPSVADQQAAIRGHGGEPRASIGRLDMHVVEVPENAADAIMKRMKDDPSVDRVEFNRKRRMEGLRTCSMPATQWNLTKIGWDEAFALGTPAGTAKLAILDTGVYDQHPDLAGRVLPGYSAIDNSTDTSDSNGHGTWLAGIVAANTADGIGMDGVAYAGVQIMPVKVLDASGEGQDWEVIAGLIFAVDNGADVILMGFSNPGFSNNLQDAIDYAWSRGVVLVAAAGNSGVGEPAFPAGDRAVIGVSATDQNDALAGFSNYGAAVFLGAPGLDILGAGLGDDYVAWEGTSASAAIVAGVAGLMKAADPSLTNGLIVGRLARTADPAGTQEQTGNGRVNMLRALQDTSMEPIQPAGAQPYGDGGPFVGPYVAAAASLTLSPLSGTVNSSVSITSGGLVLPEAQP